MRSHILLVVTPRDHPVLADELEEPGEVTVELDEGLRICGDRSVLRRWAEELALVVST